MAGHAGLGVLDEVPQALEWRRFLVQEPAVQLAGEVAGIALQHNLAEGLLAVEVVIEGALGHAHAFEHRIDAGGHEALLGEDLHAAADQRGTGIREIAFDLGRSAATGSGNGFGHELGILDRASRRSIESWSNRAPAGANSFELGKPRPRGVVMSHRLYLWRLTLSG
ncbi:hypothetical protein D3C72_1627590 [compost metagenome]